MFICGCFDGGGLVSPFFASFVGATEIDFEAECLSHGRFCEHAKVGISRVVSVSEVHVICFVLSHELIAGYAVGHSMHDGPLDCCEIPASLGFFWGSLTTWPRPMSMQSWLFSM